MGALRNRNRLGITIALGLAATSACGPGPGPPPSDAELVEAFEAQPAGFEALAEDPDGAALPTRPQGLERRPGPGDLRLIAWSRDLFGPGGCSKGYALLDEPPPALLESLDGYDDCGPETVDAFRHLEGDWYLFFWADN